MRNPLSLGLFLHSGEAGGKGAHLLAVISRATISSNRFVFAGRTPEPFLVGEYE